MTTTTTTNTTQHAAAREEHQRLVEFCATHYRVTAEGAAVFHCECRHPDDCSVWQHHPDLDAVLAQVVLSSGTDSVFPTFWGQAKLALAIVPKQ